ncbi:MAG: restriction endonuclease [Bacteroidetes bacterium]|nr:restriction endonuclease [Bacteroidota bacterium]MCW5896924.1 restriction endonuclease [Bacteroidota bacterium]
MARKKSLVPTYDQFIKPVIQALISLGGSGSNEEINNKVYEIVGLSDEILQIPHGKEETKTEVEYRLYWTRTYLKKAGLIDNSERGIWSLTMPDTDIDNVDPSEVVKIVRMQLAKESEKADKTKSAGGSVEKLIEPSDNEIEWKQRLLSTLYEISPSSFERLSQRILRESGFVQVEVTGKAGDGGIDGKGIVRVGGFLSFHVIFQCKRYKYSIGPNLIRDFRGAMQGRADKGLFITTGSFTREAMKEATRDGAPPIDLVDGELLCDKLKELKLGVVTKQIENVEIDDSWFKKV